MKTPCTCPACLILIDLALSLRSIGALDEAEMVARNVTWIDPPDTSEGYADTWQTPTTKNDQTWGN